MPNTKSAIRRTKRTRLETSINKIRKSKYKSAVKQMSSYIAAGKISYCVVSNHTSFATQYGDIYRDLNGIVPKDFLAEFVPFQAFLT